MSGSGTRVRILHLSDLHERADRETEAWRRRRVLGAAWEKNLSEILQDGPIDLVCFTGDAADWGRPAEFSAATDFLLAVLERLRVPRERLFVVPGNHDVDRTIEADCWKTVREASWKVEPLALARWLHGTARPFGFDDAWRQKIFGRLAAYRSWVRDGLARSELVRDETVSGPHAYRQEVEIRGARIQVVGLDSAWLCGDDHDAGQLRVSDEQVMRHLTQDGEKLPGFRLVLMHHPLDDLALPDRDPTRRCVADFGDLVLRGHLHSPEAAVWSDPDRRLRHLAAGCLYEGHQADQYPNGCQVLTLELDGRSQSAVAEATFYSFSPRSGAYHLDNSLYREAPGGRLRFTIERKIDRGTSASNPYCPHKEVIPPLFVGREAELRRLEASLMEGHGISIVGDSRIGKSSLLRTWESRLKASGRTVVFLDGQGTEGSTVAAFVGKILRRPAPDSADAAADALDYWARSMELPPVLLVDELDGIVELFPPRFFERLREMLGRIVVAVASRRPVDELYRQQGRTSPFDNKLRIIHLGLLDLAASEQLIALGGLSNEEQEMMREWAGKHAYHLQEIGHCLVEARIFGETREDARERYLDIASARLRELWHRLLIGEQAALKRAECGEPTKMRSLRRRGLVEDDGSPFGRVLSFWIQEQA